MKAVNKYNFSRLFLCFILILSFVFVPNNSISAKKTALPSSPTNLKVINIGQNELTLTWTQIKGGKIGITYLVYKDNTYYASVSEYNYKITVTGLTPSTSYYFDVRTKDSQGNISARSNTINVVTASLPTPSPTPSPTSVPSQTPIGTFKPTPTPEPTIEPTPTPEPTIEPTLTPELTAEPSSKIIAGYYASWSAYSGYTPLLISASKLTHINYAFANIGDDLKIAMGDSYIDPSNFEKLNQLKKDNPKLKTLISIGGFTWSGKFSDVALTEENREIFANSVVEFIKNYGFDGADIDWEYPGGGGMSTNISRPEDKTNFTLLLKTLREQFDKQGSLDNKHYLLSIAGGAGQFYANNVELDKIAQYLDYAIVMTYDIHGSWDTYSDFNAPLYTPSESSPQYKWSVDSSLKAWMTKGFPSEKIVVGVPFYGYIYNGITSSTDGLYKPFTNSSSIAYDKIRLNYLSNSTYKSFYHSVAKVPWLFNGSSFISYDDENSIGEKAKYISNNNLAGASIWELSQNKDGTLLTSLYSNLN